MESTFQNSEIKKTCKVNFKSFFALSLQDEFMETKLLDVNDCDINVLKKVDEPEQSVNLNKFLNDNGFNNKSDEEKETQLWTMTKKKQVRSEVT